MKLWLNCLSSRPTNLSHKRQFSLKLFFVLILGTVVACQPSRHKKRSVRPVVLSTEPVILPASDGRCLDPGLNLSPVGDIGQVDLEAVSPDGKLDLVSYNFSGVFESLGLSSSSISISNSNRSVSGYCNYYSSSADEQMLCNNQAIPNFDVPASPTRICGNLEASREETQESIALLTARYIQDASDFYTVATQEYLPRVAIESLPLISIIKEGKDVVERFFHVDNAYYDMNGNTVLVLPPSKDYLQKDKPLLPQSPYVLAHEMAHAVQTKIIKETIGKFSPLSSSHWDGAIHEWVMEPDLINDEFQTDPSKTGIGHILKVTEASSENLVNYSSYLSSLFEGFSDTLPYYQFGGRTETLLPYGCYFPRTRDINAPDHGNHPTRSTLKFLSSDVFATLFHPRRHSIDSFAYCEGPQFHDSHAVGGLISFILNKALAASLPDPVFDPLAFSGKLTESMRMDAEVSKRRYRAAIEWLRNMIRTIDADIKESNAHLTESEAVKFIVDAIFEVAVDSGEVQSQGQADTVAIGSRGLREKAVCEVLKKHVSSESLPVDCVF